MSRLLACLILAVSLSVPCAAQSASANAAGNPLTAPVAYFPIGGPVLLGNCTLATPVLFVAPFANGIGWLIHVTCGPDQGVIFGQLPLASTDGDSDDVRPATTLVSHPTGAGSESQAATTLANGNYVAAWTTGAGIDTGLSTSVGTTVPILARYFTGPNPQHIIAADFNGDGIADLAVSNYGNEDTNAGGNIAIFFGKGDGTFTAGPTTNASAPSPMYAVDFNGDHKMDLVYGDVNDNKAVVLLGNGDGTFQSPATYPVPAAPVSIVAADFNGDGILDLATANYTGGISVLLGMGGGAFQPAKSYPSGTGSATYLAYADVNNDGKLDLVVANPDANAISFLFGKGDGAFQAPVEYATGAYAQYFGLGYVGGQLYIGTVDALSGQLLQTPVTPSGTVGTPPIYQLANWVTGVAAADMNGDGYPDIVAADRGISVQVRVPNGAFTAPVDYPLQSGSKAVAVAVGDIDGDGKNDVVSASETLDQFGDLGGTLDVAFGNGDGTLGKQASYALGGDPGGSEGLIPSGVAIADFNGDGKPDVAAGYQTSADQTANGGMSVFINNGGGILKPAVNYPLTAFSVYCTVAGIFTGSAHNDLVACAGPSASLGQTATPGLAFFKGNGDGTFQNATVTPLGSAGGFPQAMAVGDVNGDGKLDLVATVVSLVNGNQMITEMVLLGNGDGTFRQLAPIATPASGSALALLDLNGDGILDLVVGDCCGQTESVYLLGNGDGTFQSPIYFNSGASVTGFAVTSWNKDGIAGLAIAQKGAQPGTVEAMESTLNRKLYSSAPTLSITKSHTGNFTAGQQSATYTITVSNAATAAPVAGVVTVTDTLPSGLTLVSMTGNNWTCSANTCTRNDALVGGFSYDPIAVTVNVAANAASPQVNLASVSGGGSASADTSDSTIIGSGSGGQTGTPAITSGGVVSASAFGEFASAAPGSWIEIYGASLASGSRPWQTGDFNGVNAPTMLDGTSVTIGGQPAFVDYISPIQVNVQVPNIAAGTQPLVVTTGGNKSAPYNLTIQAVDPGLLAPASFNIGGVQYAFALDGGNYVLPTGAIAGVSSAPAKPGDVIVLYGVGFGPVSPAIPEGQIVEQQNALPSFSISIGGAPATVQYAGLAPNYVGLYQFNVVVPAITANNAALVTFQVNGTAARQTLYLAVE